MLRFREAVADGAIPFTRAGPGERAQPRRRPHDRLGDRCSQRSGDPVSGSSCRSAGEPWRRASAGGLGPSVRLDTVQAEGCAPLADTWERIAEIDHPERYWSQVMRPWPNPHSLADGILDDETYDWIADVAAMVESGGRPIVAPESDIVRAHELATAAGFDVSPTGSAGLAGVLATGATIRDGERVVVIMSGVAR